jgi:hypothetical protein
MYPISACFGSPVAGGGVVVGGGVLGGGVVGGGVVGGFEGGVGVGGGVVGVVPPGSHAPLSAQTPHWPLAVGTSFWVHHFAV